MLKKLLVTLNRVPKQIIAGLLIIGFAYLILPRIASSADFGQIPANAAQKEMASAQIASNESAVFTILIGTPTPPPSITATPTLLPTVTEMPSGVAPQLANQATAEYQAALATANAWLNGVAASSTDLAISATPSPVSMGLVVITQTPTPQNIITMAAQAAEATAVATAIGTYTPVPFNWVVPEVITPPPPTAIPANAATATFQAAAATAEAFVNGTSTPLPANLWTATPTPFMRPVFGEVATPYLDPTPTPTPLSIPAELVGKIIFLSNRSGGPKPLSTPLVYAIDPDGSNLAVLTDDTFYKTALIRDTYSAGQQYRAFVRTIDGTPAIFSYDYQDKSVKPVTFFPPGQGAWDPVWSPTRDQIAFVSNASGDDEIWVVNRDGSGLKRLTETNAAYNAREIGKDTFLPEVNSHPSWSPDGSQLVFWSNRNRRREIFVMTADGSNVRSLSTTIHDDWNPIWVKYTDPPREPVLGIGAD